jgi:hypothetical protein
MGRDVCADGGAFRDELFVAAFEEEVPMSGTPPVIR